MGQFIGSCKASSIWKDLCDTEGFGGKKGYVNGYELCDHFVKPYTRGFGSGVSLMLNPVEPRPADLMLSHSWAEHIEQVQVALLGFEGLTLDTVFWFCIFANYQCGDEVGDVGPTVQEQLDNDPFGRVIQSAGLKGMLVVQTSTGDVYERLWCVYEIDEAVRNGVQTESVTSDVC